MKVKVNGKDENVDFNMGCGGCLLQAALWFWIPIIIIVLIIKFIN